MKISSFSIARVQRPAPSSAFSIGTAQKSAVLSMLAYQGAGEIRQQLAARGFDLDSFSFIDDPRSGTQGFVVADRQGNVFVAFRGTEANLRDVQTDLGLGLAAPKWAPNVKVHAGMSAALDSAWPAVAAATARARAKAGPNSKVVFTGHSLGAGLSELAALRAVKTGLVQTGRAEVYNIGAPRSGDAAFAAEFQRLLPRTFRIVNFGGGPVPTQDVVTEFPPATMGYRHVGTMIRLDERGCHPGDAIGLPNRALHNPGEYCRRLLATASR